MPEQFPTPVATDNLGNKQVAASEMAAQNSRHFLARYQAIHQRIESGLMKVFHVNDANMPADWLTKWVTARKLKACLDYVTGALARGTK